MKIAITGASGAVAEPVLEPLHAQGHELVALARRNWNNPAVARVIRGSLEELPDAFLREVRKCSVLLHFGSPRTDDRDALFAQDIHPMIELLQHAQNAVVVYASSQTVYGTPQKPMEESDGLSPETWYDIGKVVNEFSVRNMAPRHVILRLPLLFGHGVMRNNGQWLFQIKMAIDARLPFAFESEEHVARAGSSYLASDDFGEIVTRIVRNPVAGVFNVASGFCTWKEMLSAFAAVAEPQPIMTIDPRPQRKSFRLPRSRSELVTRRLEEAYGRIEPVSAAETISRYCSAEG